LLIYKKGEDEKDFSAAVLDGSYFGVGKG